MQKQAEVATGSGDNMQSGVEHCAVPHLGSHKPKLDTNFLLLTMSDWLAG